MLATANHVLITLYAGLNWAKGISRSYQSIKGYAESYINQNVAHLLLPKAMELYGEERHTHFIEDPHTKQVSAIVIKSNPTNMKNLQFTIEENQEKRTKKPIINGIIHNEIFREKNSEWEETAYSTHLYQDNAWYLWITHRIVENMKNYEGKYIYRRTGEIVGEETLKKNLEELNEIIFQRFFEKIHTEYGILADEKWFEQHVYANLLKNYSKELAEYTWKDIKIPSRQTKKLPDFISEEELRYGINKLENDTWIV